MAAKGQLDIALAVIGLTAVAIGLCSSAIKRSPLQEPTIAVLLGIGVGPYGLDWLNLSNWGKETVFLEQSVRLTLAIGLMGVALRLKRESIRALWRPVTLLLTFGMAGMWLASSALSGWLLGLSLWPALLIGAVVTPTDPVVASSIVTGPFAKSHIPLRVRNAISLESGANDGLAYLFIMLPVMMMQYGPGEAWTRWLVESLLIGVGLAMITGAFVGFAAAKLLVFAARRKLVENTSLLGYTIAFSLATLGAAKLLDADAIISVFLAGLTFNLFAERREEHEEENVQEAVARLFTLPMFVIFGIALPFADWAELGWPLFILSAGALVLRRPPVIALLFPGLRRMLSIPDAAYLGWFGPIGIAAIYYTAFARGHIDDPLIWQAGSAIIFASILIHGIRAAPLTRLYARHPGPVPPAAKRLQQKSARERQDRNRPEISPGLEVRGYVAADLVSLWRPRSDGPASATRRLSDPQWRIPLRSGPVRDTWCYKGSRQTSRL